LGYVPPRCRSFGCIFIVFVWFIVLLYDSCPWFVHFACASCTPILLNRTYYEWWVTFLVLLSFSSGLRLLAMFVPRFGELLSGSGVALYLCASILVASFASTWTGQSCSATLTARAIAQMGLTHISASRSPSCRLALRVLLRPACACNFLGRTFLLREA